MGGIVVIPARGGSKRIPRKNLLPLNGRTMIERVISTAKSVTDVSTVLVSTDDQEIARYAREVGAITNGLRPPQLADDESPTAPVIEYELSKLPVPIGRPDFVVVMYPTSIFVDASQINQMVRTFLSQAEQVDMVMTVAEFPAPIERSWRSSKAGIGEEIYPGNRNKQSQDFEKHFYDVGQAYVSNESAWSLIKQDLPVRTSLFLMEDPVVDINNPRDLALADAIIQSIETRKENERSMDLQNESSRK